MNQSLELKWQGPYAWPGYERENGLSRLPALSGVYLQTFSSGEEFIVYGAGITQRRVAVRLREHTRKYINGEYTVLDATSAKEGIRREVWHGWGYARDHREEFASRRDEIVESVHSQLSAFCIFVADPGAELRLRERIEACVMNLLYEQPQPYSTLPDRGMHLEPRRPTESPIDVASHCARRLLGIPHQFAI